MQNKFHYRECCSEKGCSSFWKTNKNRESNDTFLRSNVIIISSFIFFYRRFPPFPDYDFLDTSYHAILRYSGFLSLRNKHFRVWFRFGAKKDGRSRGHLENNENPTSIFPCYVGDRFLFPNSLKRSPSYYGSFNLPFFPFLTPVVQQCKLFRARSVFTKLYVDLRFRLALFSLNWSNLLSTAEHWLTWCLLTRTNSSCKL